MFLRVLVCAILWCFAATTAFSQCMYSTGDPAGPYLQRCGRHDMAACQQALTYELSTACRSQVDLRMREIKSGCTARDDYSYDVSNCLRRDDASECKAALRRTVSETCRTTIEKKLADLAADGKCAISRSDAGFVFIRACAEDKNLASCEHALTFSLDDCVRAGVLKRIRELKTSVTTSATNPSETRPCPEIVSTHACFALDLTDSKRVACERLLSTSLSETCLAAIKTELAKVAPKAVATPATTPQTNLNPPLSHPPPLLFLAIFAVTMGYAALVGYGRSVLGHSGSDIGTSVGYSLGHATALSFALLLHTLYDLPGPAIALAVFPCAHFVFTLRAGIAGALDLYHFMFVRHPAHEVVKTALDNNVAIDVAAAAAAFKKDRVVVTDAPSAAETRAKQRRAEELKQQLDADTALAEAMVRRERAKAAYEETQQEVRQAEQAMPPWQRLRRWCFSKFKTRK